MNDQNTSYDTIEIPVFHDRDDDTGLANQKARQAGLHYHIVHQQRFENSKGKPFALVQVHQFGSYMGHYYKTLDEAMFIARLCEWHARQGDDDAQECVLNQKQFGNIQSKQAYELLNSSGFPELTPKPYTLLIWGKYGLRGDLFFQPTLRQINELILEQGQDWRDLWVIALPPDPLHLIQIFEVAGHPTIDWTATIARVAATIVIRDRKGRWWSYRRDMEQLLRNQQIPICDDLLKAHLAVWVLSHRDEVAFPKSRSPYEVYDYSQVGWRSHTFLSRFSAEIPVCSGCGKPRSLNYHCSGYYYYGSDYSVSKPCPFDGYSCQTEQGEYGFQCCRCRAIRGLIDGKAESSEIEAEIARQTEQFAVQGSCLRVTSK